MNLVYTRIDEWPSLAWLAVLSSSEVEIAHGAGVETRPDWFAEAIWDGDWADGGLDRTDLVYGSGGRLRAGEPTFVSSGSTVDRLHSIEANGRVWVSNSLACLLEALGGSVATDYRRYFEDFERVIAGVGNYRRTVASTAGPVRLTYYDNLLWRNGRLVEVPKPYPKRDFSSFGLYKDFLESALCRLAENMRCSDRSHRYELLATISSGYDSPTVAAVARRAGLRQTLSFSCARDGRPDSGAAVARCLGLDPIVVDSQAWRDTALSEVPFIASDAKGEDVYYAGAADVLRGRVLLTGYGGSMVWDKDPAPPGSLRRSDQSGLSLCEYRLWAGFLHCPATFLGGRQTDDLCRISNAPEMAAWDVPGDYTRPICRRIVEEAGAPRSLFGMEKKAASILFFDRNSFLSEASRRDYQEWLEQNLVSRTGPAQWAGDGLAASARVAVRGLQALAGALPGRLPQRISRSGRLTRFANHERLFAHVFPWALARARHRYRCSHNFRTGTASPPRAGQGPETRSEEPEDHPSAATGPGIWGLAEKAAALKKLIQGAELSFLMEAHNGLSARIVEEAGFAAVWASGLSIAASMGVRDANEASWTQVLEVLEFMSDATRIPILVDGDTGHGNFNNARRLVRKLEDRGIAGVCIEDKVFPKTNSFLHGTTQPLADIEEFCGKIKAAKDSQRCADFVLVARVEALIAGLGLPEALERAEAYRKAGADAILIHSAQRSPREVLTFKEEWGNRLPVVIVPTKYYATPTEVFRKFGFSAIIWANHLMRSCIAAMQQTAGQIFQEQALLGVEDRIAPLAEVFRLQRAAELAEAEKRYLPRHGADEQPGGGGQ